MNHFVLLVAVFSVAAASGTHGFPETMLSRLFRRGFKKDVSCSGDVSSDILSCVEHLEFLEHPTSGLQLDYIDNENSLNYVCSELRVASSCVQNVHAECGQGDMMSELMSRTVVGIVEYLCDPANKQVILGEAECWENKQLEKDIEKCGNDIQPTPYSDPCVLLGSVRSCMTGKVAAVCSAEAANFIDGLIYRAIEPIATDLLGCQMSLRVSRSIWKMLPRSRK